jgi:hypothetical protein
MFRIPHLIGENRGAFFPLRGNTKQFGQAVSEEEIVAQH